VGLDKNTTIASFVGESGPLDPTATKYARGTVTLGGGTGVATITIPGYPASAAVLVTRKTPAGAVGDLSASYVAATGVLTVQSANAADTSVVQFELRD
jgi:hypothetical protein